MSLPVYHVESLHGVTAGQTVDLSGDEAHHAVTVRRSRVGEWVTLTDGRGRRATGPVAQVAKRLMTVLVEELTFSPEPTPGLWVVQALPKGDRGERAVEVLTEIGVARIIPWAAERSVGQWRGERADKSLAKWRSTARESSKQARREWAAEVSPLVETGDLASMLADVEVILVLHEEATVSLANVAIPEGGTVVIVVGPEGGLTDREVEHLTHIGARPVKLGAEILRTSTAGVAACAAVLSRTRRWE